MRQTLEVLRLDLSEQVRRVPNYVFFAVLFAFAIIVTAFNGSRLQLLMGRPVPLFANGPTSVVTAVRLISFLGMLGLIASVVVRAATKDFDNDFDGMLVTSGLRERSFVVGRLLAVWITCCVVLLAVPTGLAAGLLMPWNLPAHIGPFHLWPYVHGYVFHVVSLVLVAGTLVFSIALLTRRPLWAYLAGFILVIFAGMLVAPLGWFGLDDLQQIVRFNSAPDLRLTAGWVPSESNVRDVPIPFTLVANRLGWLFVGGLVAWSLATRYRFTMDAVRPSSLPGLRRLLGGVWRAARLASAAQGMAPAAGRGGGGLLARSVEPRGDLRAQFVQWRARTRLTLRHLAGSWSFWIALAIGVAMSISLSLRGGQNLYNAALYPTASTLLARPLFVWMMLLSLCVLAGECVWRERECRIDALIDVTPAPNWVFFGGLVTALIAIQALALLLFAGTGLVVQLFTGLPRLELWPLVRSLFTVRLVQVSIFLVPVLLIHGVVNSKVVGHFVTLLYFTAFVVFPSFLENTLRFPKLAIYGAMPEPAFSDMTGIGNVVGLRWFQLYWIVVAAVLLALVQALWVRGTEGNARARWKLAMSQWSRQARGALAAVTMLAVLAGGWIYYNTRISYPAQERAKLAEFGDPDDRAGRRPAIEAYLAKYKSLEHRHPALAHVALRLNLWPSEGRLDLRGTYTFENRTAEPLDEILLTDTAMPAVEGFTVDGAPVNPELERVAGARMRHLRLPTPLAPGGRVDVGFAWKRIPRAGFTDGEGDRGWMSNGLYVLSSWLPRVGYQGFLFKSLHDPTADDPNEPAPGGAKDAPPPAAPAGSANDATGEFDIRQFAVGGREARATFEGVLCTDPDQIGLLPGALEREWVEDGRHCFAYRNALQGLQFHIVSGRYDVKREKHGAVMLEVYHHPGHPFNVDALINGMRTALDVYSTAYGPYPYSVLRIAEVPYLTAAISGPGSAVYGEPFGMMARVDRSKKGAVDQPFFVAAHETAHQWWGEELLPARAPGYSVILEALAQYGAASVIERGLGPESVRTFLDQELRQYLQNRSQGNDIALAVATNQQDVYYHKGAVAIFALREALGATALDGALAAFFTRFRNGPPFPLSTDLMAAIRSAAGPDQQQIITDMLETITFWRLEAKRATLVRTPDKKFEITFEVDAAKSRSDNVGRETPIDMAPEAIEIGLLDGRGGFLYLEKHDIKQGVNTIKVIVDRPPAEAAVDPRHLRPDRKLDDNVTRVRVAAAKK